MKNSYTRQRQGRDFPFFNKFVGGEPNAADNTAKDDAERRDFLNRLDRLKAETERNAVPVDGHEPTPERGI